MPDDQYEFIAVIPLTSNFSIESAVNYYAPLSYGKTRLRSEVAQGDGVDPCRGFRVYYGDWAVVAWLDEAPGVVVDNQDLATCPPLPAEPDAIARSIRRLSIFSDEDPELNHSDHITHFTDALREHYGLFVFDPVNGEWRS